MAFSNPRLNAYPWERMRGLQFAEFFNSADRVVANAGTDTGTGNVFNRGLTLDGNGYVVYDTIPQSGAFSAVLKFSTSTKQTALLMGNANLIEGTASSGFCVWVTDDGFVKAAISDGVTVSTPCAIEYRYERAPATMVVTYSVDITGGTNTLRVEEDNVDTRAHSIAGTIGDVSALLVGGDAGGTENFTGFIRWARVFSVAITEDEHVDYHRGTVYPDPTHNWRCDSNTDDTTGDKILDTTGNANDLYKADRLTAGKYPIFHAENFGRYTFDGVDDYISNFPSLPDAYTITAITSTAYPGAPVSVQQNDSTLITQLSTEGGFTGNLHSLRIYDWELTQIQKNADKYEQLYRVYRYGFCGAFHRLITENVVSYFAVFTTLSDEDYSQNENNGVCSDCILSEADGVSFPLTTSMITIADEASNRAENMSVVLFGSFAAMASAVLADKADGSSTAWSFKTTATALQFYDGTNTSVLTHDISGATQVAVCVKSGKAPRFFVDGEFVGVGSLSVTIDDALTPAIHLGNDYNGGNNAPYLYKNALVCNDCLKDEEIRLLFESSLNLHADGAVVPITETLGFGEDEFGEMPFGE